MTNFVADGSFEFPEVPGSHAAFTTGQTIAGAWQVEYVDSVVDVFDNEDDYAQQHFPSTPAGNQFAYLADDGGRRVGLASPHLAPGRRHDLCAGLLAIQLQ